MLSINTNVSSLIVQGNLKQSTNSLNTAIERMTTGCKLNHASDNAANYSIKTNMDTKIGAYQVAEDNAMMGLDMLQTAETTLSQMSDLTSRLRSLAVQAQNGTYGTTSLSAINSEAYSLTTEIQRLYTTAKYNGINLLRSDDLGYKVEGEYDGFINNPVDYTDEEVAAMTPLSSVDPTANLLSGQYSISTPEELKKLADMTNNGKLYGGTAEFVLACDIDLSCYSSGDGWVPIGNNFHNIFFCGTFNGNGHLIKNLKINRSAPGVGLFGYAIRGIIKNLGVLDCDVYTSGSVGYGSAGAIVAGQFMKLLNCWAVGNVYGGDATGGLVGTGYGSCEHSWFKGTVEGENYVGGIAANYMGNISNCRVDANVIGKSSVGGIVGKMDWNSVQDCLFLGSVTGETNVGGIVGEVNTLNTNVSTSYINNVSLGSVVGESNTGSYIGAINGLTSETLLSKLSISDSIVKSQDLSMIGGLYLSDGSQLDLSLLDVQLSGISYLKIPSPILTFQIGCTGNSYSALEFDTTFKGATTVEILMDLDVSDSLSLAKIDDFLASINFKQTELGAAQNRLMSVLEEINVQYENLVSSRSTIQDADMGEVSATYIQQQILQQASATLMATANQTPAIALQLI